MGGLIHGTDPKRIRCDERGILKIGKTEIPIIPTEPAIMPMLFNGTSGDYEATFIASNGKEYRLEKVVVRGGWIQPPPQTTVELMELRCRMDFAEDMLDDLSKKFDTNALNFIIKENNK